MPHKFKGRYQPYMGLSVRKIFDKWNYYIKIFYRSVQSPHVFTLDILDKHNMDKYQQVKKKTAWHCLFCIKTAGLPVDWIIPMELFNESNEASLFPCQCGPHDLMLQILVISAFIRVSLCEFSIATVLAILSTSW